VPPRAQIIRVYAARAYAGTARVETSLCWGSPKGPCVLLSGSHLDSHAFDGRPARGPLWLVHRVLDWGVDHPPLFVRGTVIVWFVGGVR
jgi:flagellar protein FlhE